MSQLSPCPQCRTERVWARAALGAYRITHVAFCPGCARAATICTRCGGELVLMRQSSWVSPGRPRVEAILQCPACRQSVSQPASNPTATPLGGGGAPASAWAAASGAPATARRSLLSRFVADEPTGVVQRVADECEVLAATRYTRRRQLVGLVDEAARRADAMARLEIELSRLETTGSQ
jgi:hypothetical protein